MAGGTKVSKLFDTFHDATMFVVYNVGTGDVYDFVKVEK
jgi:hypothetical protein